jgi:hypothetical protein
VGRQIGSARAAVAHLGELPIEGADELNEADLPRV